MSTETEHEQPKEVSAAWSVRALGVERTVIALITGLIAMVFLFLTVLGQDPLPATDTDDESTESAADEAIVSELDFGDNPD